MVVEDPKQGAPSRFQAVESHVRALMSAGDRREATTEAVRSYGPEVLGLLVKLTGDQEVACEVFGMWSEDLWKGLESFEWRSSLRTWSYRLARNALHRYRRDPWFKRAQHLRTHELSGLEAQARTITQLHLKTEVKDRFRALRAELSDDQNILLVLHIDRGMSWKDIALVLHDGDPDTLHVAKETNRLRQKFHRITEKLRRLAIREGLLRQE